MKTFKLIIFNLALLISRQTFAADCPWLPVSEVDKTLVAYQPWEVDNGSGMGSCSFSGNAAQGTISLGLNQQFYATKSEAEKAIREMRGAVAKEYNIKSLPAVGKEAFVYSDGVRMTFWMANRGNAVVTATLVLDEMPAFADESAGARLIDRVLRASDRSELKQQATSCPYFDATLLKKLLPGKGLKITRNGEQGCMASTDDHRVVFLERSGGHDETSRAQILLSATRSLCSHERVEGLGQGASLLYACPKELPPQAGLDFAKGTTVYSISLTVGREPTAAQRADLFALAKSIYESDSAK